MTYCVDHFLSMAILQYAAGLCYCTSLAQVTLVTKQIRSNHSRLRFLLSVLTICLAACKYKVDNLFHCACICQSPILLAHWTSTAASKNVVFVIQTLIV